LYQGKIQNVSSAFRRDARAPGAVAVDTAALDRDCRWLAGNSYCSSQIASAQCEFAADRPRSVAIGHHTIRRAGPGKVAIRRDSERARNYIRSIISIGLAR